MVRPAALLDRITCALGGEGPLRALTRGLAPRDLSSLLLHVFDARTAEVDAPAILARFEASPAAQPGACDPRVLHAITAAAYASAPDFDAVEVSPALPLGTARALGGVHQNNVLSASRGMELLADTSAALALEAARRRRAASDAEVRLCGEHRVARMQPLPDPRLLPHFRLFARVSASRERPSGFVYDAARAHLAAQLDALRGLDGRGFAIRAVRAEVTSFEAVRWLLARHGVDAGEVRARIRANPFGGSAEFLTARGVPLLRGALSALALDAMPDAVRRRLERLDEAVLAPLRGGSVALGFDLSRLEGLSYYRDVAIRVSAENAAGARFTIADGGALDWTARLLRDGRERCFASGFGPDLLAMLFRA